MPEFHLATLEPEPFAFLTRACAAREVGRTVSETFAQLSAAFAQANTTPTGAPMAHFSPGDNESVVVDLGFPVSEAATLNLRMAGLSVAQTMAGRAMLGRHQGDYSSLGASYDAMIAAIRDAGLTPTADMWERYGGQGDAIEVELIWPVLEK